jgi:hypothetical protein
VSEAVAAFRAGALPEPGPESLWHGHGHEH